MIDAQTLEMMRGLASVDLVRLIIVGTLGSFIGELNRSYKKFSIPFFIVSFLSSAFMASIAGVLIKEIIKVRSPILEAVTALLGYCGHKKTLKWILEKKDKFLEKEK